MSPAEQRALVTAYVDAYNDFDIDGMLDVVHPDVHFQNVQNGHVTAQADGTREFQLQAEQATIAFLRREQTVLSFQSEGPNAASANVAFTGTLATDVPGLGEVGDTVEMMGRTEFEFQDGQISRIADYA